MSHKRDVTGKSLDSPENGNVDKMSEKCRKCAKNVQKLSRRAENTIFGHFLDNFCLFGRCFCLVTLSNARPLQPEGVRDPENQAKQRFVYPVLRSKPQ